ncbi:efflux RND transporter permease subunit [Methanospirillum lacunae]|uniref:Hydrogenase expression protein HypA n=1 Tax=Methanospirillum lacunae TaxID=668570 RepID=A0A2V2MXC8_9EURY|nr:hydrophobe/amphiphile efflux-3 (HAE3) family transporter [Methanospirillum lacunae]PWR72572.1 hydrogenase expression protein HypA [Methanospirillum lacunae]
MSFLFYRLANCILNHQRVVSAFFLSVILLSLVGMTLLTMETGSNTYLDKSTPKGIIYDHYTEQFDKRTLVLLIESGDSSGVETLNYIDSLKESIINLHHVSSVSAITDLIKERNGGVIPQSEGELQEVKAGIPGNVYTMYTPSNLITMVMIKLDNGISVSKGKETAADIRSFLQHTAIPPGITVTLTGESVFDEEMENELSQSMTTLILAALILMVLLMAGLFSYVRYRFLPVIMVAIGLLITFGIMGLLHIKINMAVIAAFPVLIGLGIDYAIQFQARLDEESRLSSLSSAIRTTIVRSGPAVMYAMLATSMGFVAMFISPVPMIRSFGLVSIIGVATCYLTSLIGIPLLALYLQYSPKESVSTKPRRTDLILSSVAGKIARNPVPVLLIAAFLAVAGIQIDKTLPVDTDEKAFVPPDMPAKLMLDKVTRNVGSTEPIPILVRGSQVTSPDTIRWMKEFTDNQLKKRPWITSGVSIADYLAEYNNGVLPDSEEEISAIMEKIPDDIKDELVCGNQEAQIQLYPKKLETSQKGVLKEQISRDIALNYPPPGITATITGNYDMYTSLIQDLTESKDKMTLWGFLLVLVFLILVYRNVNAITPIVPIVCIVGWNAVALDILGISYTPMTACLGSMTIGVGAEYTILVMERFLEEREKTGDAIYAITESVRKIGSSILVSGLATFFGFSALLLSSFVLISNFGLTTIIAVLFSLIGAVVIMPAILALLNQVLQAQEKQVKNI